MPAPPIKPTFCRGDSLLIGTSAVILLLMPYPTEIFPVRHRSWHVRNAWAANTRNKSKPADTYSLQL
jgi:hypothetical protein